MEELPTSSQQAMFLPSSHVRTWGQVRLMGVFQVFISLNLGTFPASAQYRYEITDFYRFGGFQSNAVIILFDTQIFPS